MHNRFFLLQYRVQQICLQWRPWTRHQESEGKRRGEKKKIREIERWRQHTDSLIFIDIKSERLIERVREKEREREKEKDRERVKEERRKIKNKEEENGQTSTKIKRICNKVNLIIIESNRIRSGAMKLVTYINQIFIIQGSNEVFF